MPSRCLRHRAVREYTSLAGRIVMAGVIGCGGWTQQAGLCDVPLQYCTATWRWHGNEACLDRWIGWERELFFSLSAMMVVMMIAMIMMGMSWCCKSLSWVERGISSPHRCAVWREIAHADFLSLSLFSRASGIKVPLDLIQVLECIHFSGILTIVRTNERDAENFLDNANVSRRSKMFRSFAYFFTLLLSVTRAHLPDYYTCGESRQSSATSWLDVLVKKAGTGQSNYTTYSSTYCIMYQDPMQNIVGSRVRRRDEKRKKTGLLRYAWTWPEEMQTQGLPAKYVCLPGTKGKQRRPCVLGSCGPLFFFFSSFLPFLVSCLSCTSSVMHVARKSGVARAGM